MMDWFFLASKLFWRIAEPTRLLPGLAIVGTLLVLTGCMKSGVFLVTVAAVATWTLMAFPVAVRMYALLEKRFADVPLPAHADGIIVLGGTLSTLKGLHEAEAGLGAPRLRKALVLMRQFPQARVYFSGASAQIFLRGPTEYELAKQFFTAEGADLSRIRYEKRARNTYQSGVYLRGLVKMQRGQVWLLVTSAAHMPRSVGVFRKTGWDVAPVPVDFRTTDRYSFVAPRFTFARIVEANPVVREWLGLLAYYLTGRISALFPAPARTPE